MPFERFVQTGRVALVSDGPHKGKLVSIVDVIDQTRVLVDGPETKVPRCEMRLNQLQLTKYKLSYPFTASTRVVRKAWSTGKIEEKWKSSLWAKHLEAKAKSTSMSDFDRFKLRRARQIRNRIRTKTFIGLKKLSLKTGAFYGKTKSLKSLKKEKKPRPEGKKLRPSRDVRLGRKEPRVPKPSKKPKEEPKKAVEKKEKKDTKEKKAKAPKDAKKVDKGKKTQK